MKRVLLVFLITVTLFSCDDGDLIVTSFDFTDIPIDLCTTADNTETETTNYIFYKINNETNETLVFQLSTAEPILTRLSGNTPYVFNAGASTNKISYRLFTSAVTGNYFCQSIPPTNPVVNEEYLSDEGTIEIRTLGVFDDNDGIATEFERLLNGSEDLDGDGLPNFYDIDDDGDNVPTRLEGVVLNPDGSINFDESLDTDGDGILNFMDPDDDGDGILTRDEDPDRDLNPNNNVTDPSIGPDYLNPNIAVSYNVEQYRLHSYQLKNIVLTITLRNLVFVNQNGTDTIRQEELFFGEFKAPAQTINVTPQF